MARTKSPRADEDALDPVEAADLEHADDPDTGLLELDPEADLDADDADDEDDADELATDATAEDDDGDDADGDPAALDADPDGADGADEDDAVGVVVLPDAAFDDDDDEVTAAVVDIEDDEDEIEGVRDGEFVCRRCYMAKRETQLVDAERLLCRDCA